MGGDRSLRREAKALRLFIAVDVPAEVKARLAATVAPFQGRVPDARWTNAGGWHVTLKFLGATWPRLVETVRGAVASAASATEPFESRLTEVGVFPTSTPARGVWGGLDDRDERFAGIVKLLDALLEEHFDAEGRAFPPHLTVARLNPPRNLREFVPDLVGSPVAADPFRVDRLTLYQSHLSPRGATYEAV